MKAAFGIATLIVFFPLSMHQMDFRGRFSSGVTVRFKKTSPAYAALEDCSHSFILRAEPPRYQQVVSLSAGKVRITVPMTTARSERLALHSLVIHQTFQPRPPLQAGMDVRVETPEGGLLPMEERKRILVQYFRKENWAAPGLRERARQLIEQAIKADPIDPDTRVIASTMSSSPIIVTKPGTDISGLLGGTSNPQKPALVASHSERPASSPASPLSTANIWRNRPVVMLAEADRKKPEAEAMNLSVSSLPTARQNPHLLKGELQIKNGLAFMGSETYFTLQRVNEGQRF